jgi:glycosyltransferase involved in cell wall biosynthesis
MKVLVIAPQPFFAERGTPIAVRSLLEALCADGHEVDLLTYPFGDDVDVEGLTIHRCGRVPGVRHVGIGFSVGKLLTDVMLLPMLWRMGRSGRYDVVHAVEEAIYPALVLRRRHRAKVIYDMDSSLAQQLADTNRLFRLLFPLLRRVEQWAVQSSDLVTPMCVDLARYARSVRAADDVVVLHDLPIEIGKDSKPPPSNGRSPTERQPSCLALYVGNLEPYQGIDMLLDATALLPPHPAVQVQVVGGPISEVERYRSLAARRGLDDRIRFLGPRPLAELHGLLTGADILLSPRTKGNNTPLKLYSYMESGRAILATRLRTHTQVLDDSTALLVEADAREFARGLLRLAGDGALRRRLGGSAKQRVRAQYSPVSFYRRVRAIYGRPHHHGPPGGTNSESSNGSRVDRRCRADRRLGMDRRAALRGSVDRRLAERRMLVYT